MRWHRVRSKRANTSMIILKKKERKSSFRKFFYNNEINRSSNLFSLDLEKKKSVLLEFEKEKIENQRKLVAQKTLVASRNAYCPDTHPYINARPIHP